MIRIVLLMQSARNRDCFTALLKSRPGYRIVGTGTDGCDGIRLVQRYRPDLVLVDENLPHFGQGRLVASLLEWSRETRVIVIAPEPEKAGNALLQAIRSGASGCYGRRQGREMFFWCLATVMRGGSMIPLEVAARAFRAVPDRSPERPSGVPHRLSLMSRQELRLLSCLGRGLSGPEIGRILSLSGGTVRNYISSIYSKTGTRNRSQAALLARQMGLSGNE